MHGIFGTSFQSRERCMKYLGLHSSQGQVIHAFCAFPLLDVIGQAWGTISHRDSFDRPYCIMFNTCHFIYSLIHTLILLSLFCNVRSTPASSYRKLTSLRRNFRVPLDLCQFLVPIRNNMQITFNLSNQNRIILISN